MTGTKKSFDETLEKTHDNDGQDEDNLSIGSREREEEENQRRNMDVAPMHLAPAAGRTL